MQEALTILTEIGDEFGLGAEISHTIALIQRYERLTGDGAGVGIVLDWMESAVSDVLALSAAFRASSQTAVTLHQDAIRLRSYVGRLRALGFHPTNPRSIHEPAADLGQE